MKQIKTSIYWFILICSVLMAVLITIATTMGSNNLIIGLISGVFSSAMVVLIDLFIKYFISKKETFQTITNSVYNLFSQVILFISSIEDFGYNDFELWYENIQNKRKELLKSSRDLIDNICDVYCFFKKGYKLVGELYQLFYTLDFYELLDFSNSEITLEIQNTIIEIEDMDLLKYRDKIRLKNKFEKLKDNYKNQLKEGIKKLNEYLHPVENIYKDMCKKYFNESIYNNAKKFLNNLDFELNDKKLNYAFREIFIKQDIQLKYLSKDKKDLQ